ncbi:MAG: BatD family protein [Porphyromonadaceae bacterium]|nr:BatD family protein [Porphyromonadaceae bacterium]
MMQRIVLMLIAYMALLSPAVADEVKFTATAPKQVIQGRQFQVTYTLQNASGSDFRAPDFPGCSVLYGPATSQSTQVSIVNGKLSKESEYTYTYTLRADKEGTYTFDAATIKAGGKDLSSNTLQVEVLPPDKNAPASSGSSAGNTQSRSSVQQQSTDEEPELFVRLILSKTTVYEQEPILATIRVYLKGGNLSGIQNMVMPSFDGFVSQEIEMDNIQAELENYNGENYQVATLKKLLLYPQHAGDIEISSGKFDFSILVVRPIPGPFRIMNSTQELVRSVDTRPVTVKVKPLPTPKPASYMNAVGSSLKLTSSLSRETLSVNEAVTYKLTLSGTANLKYMKNPELNFPVDFDVYDPKVSTKADNTESGVRGSRTIEYTIIPRSAGNFTIPSVEFSYFDLSTHTYKTLTTPEYSLTVERGTATDGTVAMANFSDKEAVKHLNQDIHYIKSGDLRQKRAVTFFQGTWGYRLCYIIPLLLVIAFALFNYNRVRENANAARQKTKKANKVAIRRLKVAGKYLQAHNSEPFYEETLKAVWGYVSDKLLLPLSKLTRDNIAVELQKYGADEELINRLIQIIDTCEFARYAPSQSNEAMDQLYAETLDVIGKMENVKR